MRAMLCRALLGLAAAAAAQEPEVVQLLQQKLALKGPQEQRLRAVEPLVWMHLPKCGSSFMNTLIQMPGFCPTANYTIDKRTGEFQLNNFKHQICPQHCDQRKLLCPEWDHLPPSNYSAEKGRLVGLFRQPEQRILSGFHDPGWRQWVPNQTLFEFAEQWKGGMAYQLTEPQDTYVFWPQDRSGVRTLEDGEEAARRVREGFAFVGITEEWDLSICLFHKMFGGPCHASEFVDSRPGPEKNSSNQTATTPYDQEVLNGWRDDVDAVVYAAAQDVFHQNLALYDVTHDSCQACYGAE